MILQPDVGVSRKHQMGIYNLPGTRFPEAPFSAYYVAAFFICFAFHPIFGSFVFDLVHYVAHRSHNSAFCLLRMLAKAHAAHHKFFNTKLQFDKRFQMQNVLLHLPMELIFQACGSLFSSLLVRQFLPIAAGPCFHRANIGLVLAVQVTRSCIVAWNDGRDSNHISYDRLSKDTLSVLVGPQYHSLHHIDPHNYFASIVRIVDWMLGTAVTLRGLKVAVTGSQGVLGQALCGKLSAEEVKRILPLRFGTDWVFGHYLNIEPILSETDILILAHGTKDSERAMTSNCHSSVDLIELFKQQRSESKLGLLPEVWYIGSEAEIHGAWTTAMKPYCDSKLAFLPFARTYYEDEEIIYWHIVPAAFQSSMGSAFVSGEWVAKMAMWWIRRGARYVPATYTGLAFANYFYFHFLRSPRRNTGPKNDQMISGPGHGFATKVKWHEPLQLLLWPGKGSKGS